MIAVAENKRKSQNSNPKLTLDSEMMGAFVLTQPFCGLSITVLRMMNGNATRRFSQGARNTKIYLFQENTAWKQKKNQQISNNSNCY